jgi:hypothetical protein
MAELAGSMGIGAPTRRKGGMAYKVVCLLALKTGEERKERYLPCFFCRWTRSGCAGPDKSGNQLA